MTIDIIARQIVSADREINTVEKSIHTIDGNISRKSKEAYIILTKIPLEKDLKRVPTYQKDLNRNFECFRNHVAPADSYHGNVENFGLNVLNIHVRLKSNIKLLSISLSLVLVDRRQFKSGNATAFTVRSKREKEKLKKRYNRF